MKKRVVLTHTYSEGMQQFSVINLSADVFILGGSVSPLDEDYGENCTPRSGSCSVS